MARTMAGYVAYDPRMGPAGLEPDPLCPSRTWSLLYLSAHSIPRLVNPV